MPPETPNADIKPSTVPRRGGRPPQKSRGRLGRNQYSRDTVPAVNGDSPANDTPQSPQTNVTNGAGNGHESSDGAVAGTKATKSKNWRLQKLSWNEIRRPAGVMQSYIAQRQVEMAGEKRSSPAPAVQSAKSTNGEANHEESNEGDMEADLVKFRTLSTTQMMDFLSRDLVHWQQMTTQSLEK